MRIESTKREKTPGGSIVRLDRPDPLLTLALDRSTPVRPGMLFVTGNGSPNYLVGPGPVKDKRLDDLLAAAKKVGLSILKQVSPATARIVEGMVLIVGTHAAVAKALKDGSVSAGETLELVDAGLKATSFLQAGHAPRRDGDALPTGFDRSRNVIGTAVKLRKEYLAALPKDTVPPPARRSELSMMADMIEKSFPVGALALRVGDLFYDLDFDPVHGIRRPGPYLGTGMSRAGAAALSRRLIAARNAPSRAQRILHTGPSTLRAIHVPLSRMQS